MNAPTDNIDLWPQAARAIGRVGLVTHRAELTKGSPSAFAAARADLARVRAKDRGAYTTVITKLNLAKAGVSTASP